LFCIIYLAQSTQYREANDRFALLLWGHNLASSVTLDDTFM